MAEMITSPTPIEDMHVIHVGQHFDASAEHHLESAVCQVQQAHGKYILLNMQDLAILDSRGVGKLFLTYHHLNRHNIRLGIVSPRAVVQEILEFVNLNKVIPIFHSIDEAIRVENTRKASTSIRSEAV